METTAARVRFGRFLLVGITAALLLLVPEGASAQEPLGLRCGAGAHAGETDGFFVFPVGVVFCPLAADPKEAHSFLTFLRGDFPTITEADYDTEVGSVGIGDEFPLFRWAGPDPGEGVQVGLVGAVFAQFDLESASFDLINADYIFGVPLTARWGNFSFRVRPYHQSSHLGDEFLLRDGELERENLSFESLEALLSQEVGPLRVYGGGEWLFRREPDTLEDLLAHAGIEARIGSATAPRVLAAVDVKSTEQQDWDPAISARAGVELSVWREAGHPPRLLGILVEFYDGPSPYGQFFQNEIRFLGVGLHFSP